MPRCKEDRNDEEGRMFSYFEEHRKVKEECMRREGHFEEMMFPDKLYVNLNPKRNERRRTMK